MLRSGCDAGVGVLLQEIFVEVMVAGVDGKSGAFKDSSGVEKEAGLV